MGDATLKLTRAVRRQIFTTDLVFCTAVTLKLSNEKLPKKTVDVLDRIETRLDNINHTLYGGTRDQFLKRISEKDRKRYLKTIDRIRDMMNIILEGDQAELDFFNAMMMVADDTNQSVKQSQNKHLRHEWLMLTKSFATLMNHIIEEPEGQPGLKFPGDPGEYNRRDADWVGYKYEDMGVALGLRFERIIAA